MWCFGVWGSARGPPSPRLLLQPQQAVGDAFLVARQPHPDALDVPGKRGKGNTGIRAGGAESLEWGWEGLETATETKWGLGRPQEQSPGGGDGGGVGG